MYKRLLVISDNLEMCIQFQNILNKRFYNLTIFDIAISPKTDKSIFENRLNRKIKVYNLKEDKDVELIINTYDLIFSIHCKQLFPAELFETLKCINVHPGYNPINRGWFPQVFSILNDLKIGATIHEIDEEIDHGNIIDRAFVEKESYDTSLTLYNKVLNEEVYLLNKNLESIINNTYSTIKPECDGDLYLKKDFNQILHLDLEEKLTMQDCINKLRALTHGNYNNAFFIDKKTGKKVHVSITLKLDE